MTVLRYAKMLIDTHAHLTDKKFLGLTDDIIKDLENQKVEKVFCMATDKKSIEDVFDLSQKYPNIYAMLGIHPEDLDDWDDKTKNRIIELSQNPKVIGIGEIGLDYHYRNDNKEKQKHVFVEQLKLAHMLKLPVSIHNRDSIGDLLEILKANKHLLEFGGVIHCFSESLEIFREIKKLGLKIGFGGTLTFKNSVTAPLVCKECDMTDFLIETDCPYLAPEPFRGKLNEPKYTTYIAQKIGLIKGVSYDTVVDQAKKNALELFKKVNL